MVCGDRRLKELADAESVQCHGLFWLLDRIHEANLLSPKILRAALERISDHPRCRLPRKIIDNYLEKFSKP